MSTNKMYRELDDLGRAYFQGYCNGQSWCKFERKSKDDYSKWDVSYKIEDTLVIGEIKRRNYDSTDFDTWVLELDKLRGLQTIKDECIKHRKNIYKKVALHYINIYNDNTIVIWDITNLDENKVGVFKADMPATYCGNQAVKTKNTIFLPITTAIINTSKK
jgi:hypothetical protein